MSVYVTLSSYLCLRVDISYTLILSMDIGYILMLRMDIGYILISLCGYWLHTYLFVWILATHLSLLPGDLVHHSLTLIKRQWNLSPRPGVPPVRHFASWNQM